MSRAAAKKALPSSSALSLWSKAPVSSLRTCPETKLDDCQHSDEERTLSGAWISLELLKAVELGYQVRDTNDKNMYIDL